MFINVQTNKPESQNSVIERLATFILVILEISLITKSVTKCHRSEEKAKAAKTTFSTVSPSRENCYCIMLHATKPTSTVEIIDIAPSILIELT